MTFLDRDLEIPEDLRAMPTKHSRKRYSARISQLVHYRLIEAFRRRPGNYDAAAKEVGVSDDTAKLAWERGWDKPEWAVTPIRDLLEEEKIAARTLLERRTVSRELAATDAEKQRAREAEASRATLSSAMTGLAQLGSMSQVSIAASKMVALKVEGAISTGALTIEAGMKFLLQLSLAAQRVSTVVEKALQIERLRVGDPTQVVQIVQSSTRQVDAEAALREIGEETFKKALHDMAEGKMTDDVQRLVEWQVERQGPVH